MKETMDKQVSYLEYTNRENSFHHHRYDDDMRQFELLKNGDLHSVDESKRMITSEGVGHLSDDPVINLRYLNICHATLCTRFAIEGGMDAEKAYNASDVFIRRCDSADTLDEQYDLHIEMTEYFTRQVAAVKKANVFSKPVILCMDYIQYHLHEPILVSELASMCRLSDSYLSVLFKRETGMNITEYIMIKRMETAENMLKFSDYSPLDIGNYLNFSSHSHFIFCFRKHTGMTPKQYRENYFRMKWTSEKHSDE